LGIARIQHRRAEEARAKLPSLLADAEKGRTTIITRRGRSVAALGPVKDAAASRQLPLVPLAGSGKGLWGRDSTATVRRLRREWSR
jgi:antitoxin (DNA-binding transcriptional repressor) of toxin-antitoxin stability system